MNENLIETIDFLPRRPNVGGYYKFEKAIVNNYNHTIHKYPAKFIPQFPKWALEYIDCTENSIVLDPFCGSGTTLVEAGVRGCKSIGYDISPLAVLISKAKTAIIARNEFDECQFIEKVLTEAKKHNQKLEYEFSKKLGGEYLGMHRTWSNWFRPQEMGKLISLRDSINSSGVDNVVKDFALVCLSSVVKSCSFLSEDQIKVRFDNTKEIENPFIVFKDFFLKQFSIQLKLSDEYINKRASFEVEEASAINLPYNRGDVDLIVTSPPYINAVDYTMSHKYNLFILNLIRPTDFWEHSHKYIGVTERAVKSIHLKERPFSSMKSVQNEIEALWNIGTMTAKNRSYIVAQYFNGMKSAFKEMHRVLKNNGKLAFVIGESNRICGRNIQTSILLKEIAEEAGFNTELQFFHVINNRSSLRANRGTSAGEIKNENVMIFNKR